MPGILPMKVIKMGTTANMRIAQACDRCRSKKIRCDGIRPCCTQCSSVGFECKTSDKLSRRAFPRGYTESLEERVRSLESEVRELKDLLDEKDEKIDMLTRIHPQRSSPSIHLPPPRRTSSTSVEPNGDSSDSNSSDENNDVTFRVQQSPHLTENSQADSYFVGTSSASSFLDSFKEKVQEQGRSVDHINAAQLLKTAAHHQQKAPSAIYSSSQTRAPPRLTTDQLVNVYFQEWAPLFPVLHRPGFLALYEQFTSAPESVTDKKSIAQLYLVFGLGALSQGSASSEIASFESRWQAALQPIQTQHSLATLQCLLLAQLFCMQKGDCSQLLTYKSLAISLSARLGLHQSQKRFALGTLTCETRKKVFWTLYTIDAFSAVQLGLPQQIKDEEVFCEFPVDADDEYITEKGFQPLLPGESTRVSSALALFRASRILSRVLTQLYPALPSYELSLKKISALAEELDEWQSSLAPHLRLPFAQDKPTVGTVSSRSPLLSLTYHYIRALIHRPAVCASLGNASSSSTLAMATSSKHIAQILSLLTERGLSFSFCLNKEELLVLSGFGLLFQGLNLDENSKVLKDNHKTLASIMTQLDLIKASVGPEFRRVACSFLPAAAQGSSERATKPSASRHSSEGSMPATHVSSISSAMKQQFKNMTSKFSWPDSKSHEQRRMTHTGLGVYGNAAYAQSQPVLKRPDPVSATRPSRSEPARSPQDFPLQASRSQQHLHQQAQHQPMPSPNHRASLNLDYLSFSSGTATPILPPTHHHSIPAPSNPPPQSNQSDWERLLATIDNGQTNIFDNIYGGPPVDLLHSSPSVSNSTPSAAPLPLQAPSKPRSLMEGNELDDTLCWDPDVWAVPTNLSHNGMEMNHGPESVFSLSSTDEGNGSTGFSVSDEGHGMYHHRGVMIPDLSPAGEEDGIWDVDGGFGVIA